MNEPADLDACVGRFERAWLLDGPPEIAEFLPPAMNSREQTVLLLELICVDLEFRWKQPDGNPPLLLEDYIARFPAVGSVEELPVEVIAEEYRARQRWGDAPSRNEFVLRFREPRDSLVEELRRIDCELHDEIDDNPLPSPSSARGRSGLRPPFAGLDENAPLPYSDYVLKEQIGMGASGKVYRALQKSLNRNVAIKYLRKSFVEHQPVIERFVDEARTVARFNHRGIVGIHGLGRTPNGGYFIVMDYAESGDLQKQMDTGNVSLESAVNWLIEACDAVQHAHDHNVVHCDLKPSNLLLDRGSHIRVTDFGLARSTAETSSGWSALAGTPCYMAPEQVSDYWGPIGPRSDVYGLGAVFFALLTGRPPYSGGRVSDVLSRVVTGGPIPNPLDFRPELPVALTDVCIRCLCKSPAERIATAAELRAALEDAQTERPR